MIIQCINCNKNFEVSSSLIPEKGRNIQCGSCNHIWFYQHKPVSPSPKNKNNDSKNISETINTIIDKKLDTELDLIKKSTTTNLPEIDQSTNFSLSKVLSYIIVIIISFIAFVVLMDTFKSPLTNIFPSIELLLYNLFESIEDMFLFFKNLLI